MMGVDAIGGDRVSCARWLDGVAAASAFQPIWLREPRSWVGHIPFAHWLLGELRPGRIVELGTHIGNSFFAMAQSVDEAGLDTVCHAVDTWQGDAHAGHYDDSIHEAVASHAAARYPGSAVLHRMTFDTALPLFGDGSVDLLHIDGLHTYDAVRHDFETWLPKVRPGGIILFHDTMVRDGDFGVWRLWDEIRVGVRWWLEMPEFHGLGVLQVGHDHAPVHPVLDPAWEFRMSLVRCFTGIGQALSTALGHRTLLEAALADQQARAAVLKSRIAGQKEKIATLKAKLEAARTGTPPPPKRRWHEALFSNKSKSQRRGARPSQAQVRGRRWRPNAPTKPRAGELEWYRLPAAR